MNKFIDIPNIEAITVKVKYRSVVELELQKYFKKNERTKKYAEIYTPFLPDEIEDYLNGLSRHDFFKFAIGCYKNPKLFRKYFNRVWLKYRFKFSPLQEDKELRSFAKSIAKAFNPNTPEIVEASNLIVEENK